MSDTPPRVRVTAPPRQRRTPQPRSGDLDQGTRLGGVYLGSLLRDQLWLAARTLGMLFLGVGSLPLLFFLVPQVAELEVLGIPVTWLVLGGGVYPLLLLLGWRYVRQAERNERDFAELVNGRAP